MSLQELLSRGLPHTMTVGTPGAQGATSAGWQGMGVSSSKAILENLHIEKCQKQKTNLQLSFEEDIVVKLLETGAKELEEIEKKSNLPINILSSCLTMLEIRGIISRMPGGLFCLK